MSAPLSPGMLTPHPTRRKGIRKLNRMPIYIGLGVLAIVSVLIVFVFTQKMHRAEALRVESETNHQTKGAGSFGAELFASNNAPAAPVTPPRRNVAAVTPLNTTERPVMTMPVQQQASPQLSPDEEARVRAWQGYYQQLAQIEQAKADAANKAMLAGTDASDAPPPPPPPGSVGGPSVGQAPPAGFPAAGTDAGAQAEKRAFLGQDGDPLGLKEDLLAVQHGPKLDTIMQGTPLPGVMIGGMSSDMPGMIVGSIAENVYDTATGNDLLIPQGARVIGTYDNSVSAGQERIGVIWNRIIFPDTSSIQLGSMEGADQGGYAGFHDIVNKHWWDKFGSALLISIAGAGIQLSQPQATNGQNYSPTSIGSASLGQQFGQLGQEYARAGMAIPNSLEIRPGYRFVLMVQNDIHLPPYVDKRTARVAPATFGPMVQ